MRGCESNQAVDRVQETYKPLLRAAASREPRLYAAIGETLQARRRELSAPAAPSRWPQRQSKPQGATPAELANVLGAACPD